jgi:hypothetical protein
MSRRLAVLTLALVVLAATGCRRKGGRGPYLDPAPAAYAEEAHAHEAGAR